MLPRTLCAMHRRLWIDKFGHSKQELFMNKSVPRRTWQEVLRFSSTKISQTTVRKNYARYRSEARIPARCDISPCPFHTNELKWNDKPLPVILDHINGVRRDNRPQNLRYLCPNCDSQLLTRGGRNKGRVRQVSDGGYVIATRDGKLHYTLVAEVMRFQLSGGNAVLNRSGTSIK